MIAKGRLIKIKRKYREKKGNIQFPHAHVPKKGIMS